jgi:arabinose-5-phosphate isomerase
MFPSHALITATPFLSLLMNPELISYFRQAMVDEAHAVEAVGRRIQDESISAALRLIVGCTGKLVLLGVGKSGLIARKIAATFSSLSIQAVFMHASDAVHGDLGLLAENDLVFMLSNSGETDELVALLPHMLRRRVHVIAIVGNLSSTLAREASVVLDAAVEREVCSLNLAPTASTTVALAIGDALAVSAAKARQLSRDAFAINHPAGRLGKRLTLRVGDFLHDGDPQAAIAPSASWREVVMALSEYRLGAVNVVDAAGKLLGIITDGDLRRALFRNSSDDLAGLTAEKLMTRDPVTTRADVLAYDALQQMSTRGDRGLSVLPVVATDGLALGLLRLQELTKAGI